METLDPKILAHLRNRALARANASELLRDLSKRLGPHPHTASLIKYIRTAFNLSLGEASPIAAWAPDGTGELSDERLDELVDPEIGKHRADWENFGALAS